MKKLILALVLFLGLSTVSDAVWYQVYKTNYTEGASTATWIYSVGEFNIGTDTSTYNIVFRGTGTIEAIKGRFFGTVTSSQTVGSIHAHYGIGSGTVTVVNTQGTFYILEGTSTLNTDAIGWFDQTQDMRLTYVGKEPKIFMVNIHVGLDVTGGNNQIIFVDLYKNNSVVDAGGAHMEIDAANDITNASFAVPVSLTTDDYLEVKVANLSSTNDIETHHLIISADAGQ